ncbi:hypothetical protein [Moorena sp. SIO3I6]|uniref:hypothetical protein n=1 Tax=Moorena sp. SIO3I6 TaxID=2607831 RepID=UPI0013F8361F|nr:hypothetical protein [Moorena sp. SIO3I6]NEP28308.1 hypothetical protein [Moorena sp. SIO3I6]
MRFWESGIGNRESGVGNRESGIGSRESGRIFVLYKWGMILIVLWNGHLARDQYL